MTIPERIERCRAALKEQRAEEDQRTAGAWQQTAWDTIYAEDTLLADAVMPSHGLQGVTDAGANFAVIVRAVNLNGARLDVAEEMLTIADNLWEVHDIVDGDDGDGTWHLGLAERLLFGVTS